MKSPIASLAAVLFLVVAADARAGLVDLAVAPGSVVNQGNNGVGTVLALTTATTTGVPGVPDGSYSITGADLHILTTTTLSITGIPGEPTILGSYGNDTQTSDGSGGFLLKSDVVIAAPAGYSAYDNGTLTLDVTSAGVVKTGDLVLGATVPEPASLAMMAIGLGAAFGGYQIRRRKAATA
jgi:PEP-CTERM motif